MTAPTCFGITLPSSGSVPSAFWEMLNWEAVDRILWMGVLCVVTWCAPSTTSLDNTPIHNILSTASQLSIPQKALETLPEDGNVMPKYAPRTASLDTTHPSTVFYRLLLNWASLRRHYERGAHHVTRHNRRLGGPQGRSDRVRKISPPPGFEPRTFQPVAYPYTDWATQHTNYI